jgi:hypothetical protein
MNNRLKAIWEWCSQPTNLFFACAALIPIIITGLYAYTAAHNALWRDQWDTSVSIAVGVKDGTFSFGDLFTEHAGHLFVLNYLSTAVWTVLTGWNIELETYANLVWALANFLLLIALFARQLPHKVSFILVPFAMLVFSLEQEVNWTTGFMVYSQLTNMLILITFLVLGAMPQNWRTLFLAGVSAAIATFSSANGMVIWGAVVLVLPWLGYRERRYWLAWIGAGVVFVVAYLLISKVGVQSSNTSATEQYSSVDVGALNLIGVVHFALIYLGGIFSVSSLSLALMMAVLGVGLFGLNLWILRREASQLAIWLGLAVYATGNGFLTAVGRLKEYNQTYLSLANSSHYGSVSLLFWVAFIVVLVYLIQLHVQSAKRLIQSNLLFVVIGIGLLVYADVRYLQQSQDVYRAYLGEKSDRYENEICLQEFPLTRNTKCFDRVAQDAPDLRERALQVAVYGLAIHHRARPAFVLGAGYQPDSPIVIDTDSLWLNAYIREWMLNGISETVIFHRAPPTQYHPTDHLEPPLAPIATDFSEQTLAELTSFIGEQRQVWYVFTPETETNAPIFDNWMDQHGYAGMVVPIAAEAYRDSAFTVIRFQQEPQGLNELAVFGDAISLQGRSISLSSLEACQPLIVQTWWLAKAPLTINHTLLVEVLDGAGTIISQSTSAPIANIPAQFWRPNRLYFDERILPIPCENLGYTVRVKVFREGDFNPVLVTSDDEQLQQGILGVFDK